MALARVTFSFSLGLLVYQERHRLAGRNWHWSVFWLAMAGLVLLSSVSPNPPLRPLFDCVYILVGCPAILLIGLNASPGAPRLAETLGLMSYPLYATHFAVMIVVRTIFGLYPGNDMPWLREWTAAATVTSVLALAYLLGRYADPRAQKWAGRMFGQRPVGVPDADLPKGEARSA